MNVLVVGSGIIGLSIAFELALAGHRVKVITRNYEEGASWVAGGMLAPYSEGLEGDLLTFSTESLSLYPEFLDRLGEVSKLSVSVRYGILRLAVSEEEYDKIAKKINNLKTEVEKLDEAELSRREPLLAGVFAGGFFFAREGSVDTEKMMDALLFACENLKVSLIVDEIVEVCRKNEKIDSVVGLKDTYNADFYVFATGAWSRSLLGIPVLPVKGQILKIKGVELDRVYYSEVSYIIPKDNYVLVGATSEDAGFDGRVTLGGVKDLLDGAIRVMPSLSRAELLGVKVGFRPATPDKKPILWVGDNYAICTGHYRNGILWAPVSAHTILSFVERGERSPFFSAFSLGRFSE